VQGRLTALQILALRGFKEAAAKIIGMGAAVNASNDVRVDCKLFCVT
jgi:hypothetical protein